jgi:hypothetical protein
MHDLSMVTVAARHDADVDSADRREAVRDLVERRRPTVDAAAALKAFPWDSDEPLVVLTPALVVDVLDEYLAGGVSAEAVMEWAEAIELRDDIDLADERVNEVIFELANPLLTSALTPDGAVALRARLID